MLTLTSNTAAASAEQLLQKIARDQSILRGMVADYFQASGGDTFPDADTAALSLQDAIAALDDLKSAVKHALRMWDERSMASVY